MSARGQVVFPYPVVCIVCGVPGNLKHPPTVGESWACSKGCVDTLAKLRAHGPQLPVPLKSLDRLPGEIARRLVDERLAGPWRIEGSRGGWEVRHADAGDIVPCRNILHAGHVAERLNAWEMTRGL